MRINTFSILLTTSLALMMTLSCELAHAQNSAGKLRQLRVEPREFVINGARQTLQLVATGLTTTGQKIDATESASYEVLNPSIVQCDNAGHIRPLANGDTKIRVRSGAQEAIVSVSVRLPKQVEPVSFDHQALPVLAKAGCSGGACHGSPNGKAGFRLSLFGFEPEFDRNALTRQLRGRRVNVFEPDNSLLLKKPTMQIPHAGGRRLTVGTDAYKLVRDWIGEGCRTETSSVKCVGIEVFPSTSRVLRFPHASQQFRVEAKFADGTKQDVTKLAQFSLSEVNVASVTESGKVTGHTRGETAVIIRYLEFIETPLLTFVRDVPEFKWSNPPVVNYVDKLVDDKLKQLQYLPSDVCSDEVFLRRVFLDVIGLLPQPYETQQFLADRSPDKRSKLIDQLLSRPEFAKFQAQKWGDLLRVSRKQMGLLSVFKFSRWLEGAVGTNMPYDQFAHELITASGSTIKNPAGNFYRTAADTVDAMETAAQLFLGVRIQCAKCHNHPFERWTMNHYYGMAAFFNRVDRQRTSTPEEVRLVASQGGDVRHPADGRVMQPWVPGVGNIAIADGVDRREVFADWLTSKDNQYFAKVEVNRLWAHMLGRGIVEPFDDLRDSNPPANAPLLDALAKDFIASGYDRVHILRTILNSRTYQTDSRPNKFNRGEAKYFSHYQPRRLTAEQLVDALGDVTGRPEHFQFVTPDTRATWLPAPDLKPHDRAKLGDIEFLKVFGQPERQSVCECDRGDDTSLGQALELINGKFLQQKLESRDNRFHRALQTGLRPREIVVDLYLRALARMPTELELSRSLAYIAPSEDKPRALEDVCWAIVNKDEFLFQH